MVLNFIRGWCELMANLNTLTALTALLLMKQGSYRSRSDHSDCNDMDHITFAVYGPGRKEAIVPPVKVKIKDDETVIEASARILTEKKIPFEVGGSGQYVYIKSINGLSQGDKGPQSGWLYKVNGEFPSEYAAEYELDDGDKLEWVYTTNFGKDVGAPQIASDRKNNFVRRM